VAQVSVADRTGRPTAGRVAPSVGAPTRLPLVVGGLGACVPERCVTNQDLTIAIETSDEWIMERTGIRERRVVSAGQATSDLAIAAGRAAMTDAGLTGADIDLVVLSTCTADSPMPATSSLIARDLGISGGAFDLGAACSGWPYGLVTAASMLTAGGGRAALVIGAEVMSMLLDPTDRATLPLFGDGAAAAVIMGTSGPALGTPGAQPTAAPRPAEGHGPGLLGWDLGVDGAGADLLRVPAGGSRLPATDATLAAGDHFIKMDGREVFRRAVRCVEASCRTTLAQAGVDPSDVALFVPHQANSRIVDAIVNRLGLVPERAMMNIDRYGNTSAASIPLALCEAAAARRLVDGDLVLLAGFGAGMTWATVLTRWAYTGGGPAQPSTLPA